MSRTLDWLDRHPWAPVGLVMTLCAVLSIPALVFVALFVLGEAAMGS
jgi:hypothetical protein